LPIADIFASLFGSSEQAGAAESAQKLQAQEAQNALNFQEQEWNTTQKEEMPWLTAGQGAIESLAQMVQQGNAGTGPLAPWTGSFTAPTAAQAEATPGYQFELGQGEQAVENSAAANGGLLSGGTLKATTNYAEGLASTNYEQAFNNALTQYQTAYNQFQQNQANIYNRTAGVAGAGQQVAQALGTQGQNAANTTANIDLTTGAQQGQDIQNAAYQTASGYTGAANALTNTGNSIGSLAMLQQILQGGGAAAAG
jgi:hypothetical protein